MSKCATYIAQNDLHVCTVSMYCTVNKMLFYRVNPDKPERMDIGEELKFGPRTKEENERRAKWDKIWSKQAPTLMTNGKRSKTWSSRRTYSWSTS